MFNLIELMFVLELFPGEKGRRIRELTSVVQKRFKFPDNSVELYAEKVNNRALCAIAQAESLRYKLLGGLAVRRYTFCINAIVCQYLVPCLLLLCYLYLPLLIYAYTVT